MLGEMMTVVREAGKRLRAVDLSELDVFEKTGKRDLCTACDIEVQDLLFEKLSKLLPEARFIGEEQAVHPSMSGWTFVVDPIDGTANFARDFRHSAISVGLVKDDVPMIGVVYNPFLDELFYAQKDSGAFLNGKQLHVSSVSLSEAMVGFGTCPYNSEYTDDTFELAKRLCKDGLDVRRSGSAALDLCYVAAGRLDLFYEFILRPWDFVAGSVIVTEAGGTITAISGKELDLKRDSSVLAAGPVAHAEFLSRFPNAKKG